MCPVPVGFATAVPVSGAAVDAAGWSLRHATALPVRRWAPGAGSCRTAGPLHVRTAGAGEPVTVLLHGLVASGDMFGVRNSSYPTCSASAARSGPAPTSLSRPPLRPAEPVVQGYLPAPVHPPAGTGRWLYAAVFPGLPVPLARRCAHHTGPSYLAGLDIVLDSGWQGALGRLDEQSVPVLFAWGSRDPIAVPAMPDELAARHRHVRCVKSGAGNHYLPIAHPQWSAAQLAPAAAAGQQPRLGSLGPDQPT